MKLLAQRGEPTPAPSIVPALDDGLWDSRIQEIRDFKSPRIVLQLVNDSINKQHTKHKDLISNISIIAKTEGIKPVRPCCAAGGYFKMGSYYTPFLP